MNNDANIPKLKAYSASLVTSFQRFKNEHDLGYDEVLIFLALGGLNFEPGSEGLMYVKPASTVALVAYLDIPRETLRRKLLLLEDRGLVQRSGSGYAVKSLKVWMQFDELLNGDMVLAGGAEAQ